jgi:hypothetical protein
MTNDSSPFLVLVNDHALRVVESVGDSMAAGLRTVGVDAHVLALPRDGQQLMAYLAQPVAGILALGPVLLSVQIDGVLLHRRVSCPVWLYFLDAPIYDLARVPVTREFIEDAQSDPRLIPVSPEAGYQVLLGRRAEGGYWPAQAWHLPFGCFPKLGIAMPPAERQPRICVIATIGDELGSVPAGVALPRFLARTRPASVSPAAIEELAHVMLSAEAPAMPAEAAMRVFKWDAHQMVDKANLPFLCGIDSWAKRERRIAAVRSLAGTAVDFYGSGWKEVFGDLDGFRYMGQIRHDDIARRMTHYAALLNFDPNWSAGMHDRLYTACSMGVPVLTNYNTGLEAARLPSDLVHVYDFNRPAPAPLAERAIATATSPALPRLDVIGDHGWSNRMARLIA